MGQRQIRRTVAVGSERQSSDFERSEIIWSALLGVLIGGTMYLVKVSRVDGTTSIVAAVESEVDAKNRVAALKASGQDAYYVKE
jgi:hypothetical protein